MKVKTANETPIAATATPPQKQAYKSPILRVYGAVHQFTQGTRGTNGDGSLGMTRA